MQTKTDTLVDVEKAEAVWLDYQQANDLSGLKGKVVGIDPTGGNVWIGDTIFDVWSQRNAAGVEALLMFERIGYPACFTKVGRY